VIGWAGLRAAAHGVLPGAEIFQIERSEAKAPQIIPTEFPPIEPIPPAAPLAASGSFAPAAMAYGPPPRPDPVVVYYTATSVPRGPTRLSGALPTPTPAPQFYSPIPSLNDWPVSRIAMASMPATRSAVVLPGQSLPVANKLDRLQVSAWALLRPQQGGISGPQSLATSGMLGGSQAGGRLNYNVTRQIAASFRTTSEVGRRGGEVAAGMRIQPIGGIPVWFTAERRQRVDKYGGGRNAFALFLEGGVYDRPMPWQFNLDGYLQGGVVGFHHRDRFIDGGFTLTRPV
jgi:hypothetical protein